MKRSQSAFVCVFLLMMLWLAIIRSSTPGLVTAEDAPRSTNAESPSKTADIQKGPFEWAPGQTYPNFLLDEVIELAKSETEKLQSKRATKSADELRLNLNRTSFTTKLPMGQTKDVAAQELYRRTMDSVFLVIGLTRPKPGNNDWRTAFSTAFVVHEDGVLSTSAHVFDHEEHDDAVVVFDVKGAVYPVVELLAVDRKADTCLFRVAAKNLKPLPLGSNLPPGSEIRVMGHPGESLFYFTAGHIGNYEHDERGQTWMNVTADFGQGSSGGPVMDAAGNVVGQVSRTYTLYAGGETANRRGRMRRSQQPAQKGEASGKQAADSPDPQMVFKACTPVSAIRALVK